MNKQGASSLRVSIRIRPLNPRELAAGERDITRVEDKLLIILDMHDFEEKKNALHRSREQRYVFDQIFKDATNEQVYQGTAASQVPLALQGINACVFAYGPTGSGKTYTMLGSDGDPGIAILVISDLFNLINADMEHYYELQISYVEIYNEAIRDLLVPNSGYLDLRDDPVKGITIAGLTEIRAENTE